MDFRIKIETSDHVKAVLNVWRPWVTDVLTVLEGLYYTHKLQATPYVRWQIMSTWSGLVVRAETLLTAGRASIVMK